MATNNNRRNRLFVAAIDFGTTYSGYAFSSKDGFKTEPLKIVSNVWNAGTRSLMSHKAPTALLLKPDKTFQAFGYEAENKYIELSEEEDDYKDYYYFHRFKMILHKNQKLRRETLVKDESGKTLSAKVVFAHAMRYLRNHLLTMLKDNIPDIGENDIQYVLTVPAIWDDNAKHFMREAAKEICIQLMDEQELEICKISAKEWKCPVCSQVLSRKQTLQNHLYSMHEIQAGPPAKRYKLYDYDDSVPVPKSTQYYRNQMRVRQNFDEHHAEQQTDCASGLIMVDNNSSENLPCLNNDTIAITDFNESDMDIDSEKETDVHYASGIDDCWSEEDDIPGNEVNIMSDEEELDLQCCSAKNDPPVYVIPPSTNTYCSSISKFEHIIATSGFAARHNLSDTAIKDLLTLLQLHMPQENTGETNINELKKKCGFNKSYITFHLYCSACKKLFSEDAENCKTVGCTGLKTDSQCMKYFITSDIKQQLTEILQREGILNVIIENLQLSTSSKNICDVRNGQQYQKLHEPGGFLHNSNNITFSMFTDGVPLFKSSGVQMWPVYILINEIPPKQRFLRKNMLLWGVWQGKGKPKMNMFLRPLISDLTNLYNEGLSITVDHQEYCIKAMLILATMDLQARAYVTGMTQHNGEYGCLYCEEPGTVVSSGAGNCRSYIQQMEPAPRRTDQTVREHAKLAHESGVRHKGFVGLSVLNYLPYFSMTNNIVIDYMHGVLLGITKKLIELWFDHKYTGAPHYIGQSISEVDRILKSIQPPYLIHRLPRIISGTFQHWKASELRNWLLFYAVPCLEDYLPALYFKHFCCLVEAIYILLTEGITSDDLAKADRLLNFFVSNAAHLYGKNTVSLNVHNLTHLTEFVRMWGPIWCWSCFPFESFNGEIKKNIHGTGNVCRQIFWTFQAQKRIMQSEEHIEEGKVKEFVKGMFDSNCKETHVGKEAYRCRTVKTSELKKAMEVYVKDKLKELVGNFEESSFLTASKVVYNGFYMYSSTCTKVKKQNSYTIAFAKREEYFAMEIEGFLVHSVSKCVFAIGKLIKSKGNILNGYTPHIHRLEYSDHGVVKVQDLFEPLVVVKKRNQLFGALFPNHFERD